MVAVGVTVAPGTSSLAVADAVGLGAALFEAVGEGDGT